MCRVIIIAFILLSVRFAMAQNDSAKALQEITQSLQSGRKTTQDILKDKQWIWLHPQTSFRDLIKQFPASTEILYVPADEPGKKIKIVADIQNSQGKPVSNALVYCYQTDTRGWYASDAPHINGMEGDRRHARLFTYIKPDENGEFILHTIQPNGYPNSTLAGHIHVEITAEGYQTMITEFQFDDDPRLVGPIREQSIREGFLIVKASGNNTYHYTVHLTAE